MSRDGERDAEASVNADADAGDDFQAEVSDLRPSGAPASPLPTAPRSPLAPRRTLRQRLTGLTITLCVLALAVGLIWRASAGLRLSGPPLQPTATTADYTNLFYLLPNPPGVVVSLDGHPLTRLPAPGDPQPLPLNPGSHTFVWVSNLLPFKQVQCRVSVPASLHDTCPFVPLNRLPVTIRGLPGKVIGLHPNITSMESGPASTLQRALEESLAASAATAEVQPGESYYYATTSGNTVARQPLRATLTYEWVPSGGYPEPCILAVDQIPCRFPGQDCGLFCTVDTTATAPAWRVSPANTVPAGTEWDAAILVHATWSYTTLDGHLLLTSPEGFGMQLLALRILWDGANWHVTPVFGHVPGFDVADDPVCDPARYWISQSSWGFMLGENPPPGSQAQFASDANPADGCVAVLNQAPGNSADLAIFLERFGVLVTVNDTAVNPTDNLPTADAAEQAIANHLLAQLQPS